MAGFGRNRGFRTCWGFGRRFMNRAAGFFGRMPSIWGEMAHFQTPTPEAEKHFLQTQAQILSRQLDEIKNRLEKLADSETLKE